MKLFADFFYLTNSDIFSWVIYILDSFDEFSTIFHFSSDNIVIKSLDL